ncbi:MAG: hypothetical protein A2586_01145 [Candidatus Harrisonbacteria bacterium RIFOXYD1_FULL_40_9]|uniref:Uncharacterized protein n=1 Tax=Candidatus Harrisonbacteria bacterium RIFOXYD1_FULL_40_9 TaxID=1798412 RepID=A0A1G1ZX00_9BACT|nr:MAG: hypothetical protein A2586_01145 [Candidatus Harrisonbacteria bacterium RIFOXYD1_FULL_40_9]
MEAQIYCMLLCFRKNDIPFEREMHAHLPQYFRYMVKEIIGVEPRGYSMKSGEFPNGSDTMRFISCSELLYEGNIDMHPQYENGICIVSTLVFTYNQRETHCALIQTILPRIRNIINVLLN